MTNAALIARLRDEHAKHFDGLGDLLFEAAAALEVADGRIPNDDEFAQMAQTEAGHRIHGASGFAQNVRGQLVEMAEWARGVMEVRAWAAGSESGEQEQ